METKKCRGCHNDRLLKEFCLNKNSKDGLNPRCRYCEREKNKRVKQNRLKGSLIVEDLPNEIWKDVVGFEGFYKISNLGRIKSVARKFAPYEEIINGTKNNHGYSMVCLTINSKHYWFLIHRLMANHFIPNPKNKLEVNHKNGNKSDFRLENLEWCTRAENTKHSYDYLSRKGAWEGKGGAQHPQAKKINQIDLHGNVIKTWGCLKEAANNYNIKSYAIYMACKRQKTLLGFKWQYKN